MDGKIKRSLGLGVFIGLSLGVSLSNFISFKKTSDNDKKLENIVEQLEKIDITKSEADSLYKEGNKILNSKSIIRRLNAHKPD